MKEIMQYGCLHQVLASHLMQATEKYLTCSTCKLSNVRGKYGCPCHYPTETTGRDMDGKIIPIYVAWLPYGEREFRSHAKALAWSEAEKKAFQANPGNYPLKRSCP